MKGLSILYVLLFTILKAYFNLNNKIYCQLVIAYFYVGFTLK